MQKTSDEYQSLSRAFKANLHISKAISGYRAFDHFYSTGKWERERESRTPSVSCDISYDNWFSLSNRNRQIKQEQ